MTQTSDKARLVIDKMIELFEEYEDYFGMTNDEFAKDEPIQKQLEFEEKFNLLICEYQGHEIGSDQCGLPEHDYCYRCFQLKSDIENNGGPR